MLFLRVCFFCSCFINHICYSKHLTYTLHFEVSASSSTIFKTVIRIPASLVPTGSLLTVLPSVQFLTSVPAFRLLSQTSGFHPGPHWCLCLPSGFQPGPDRHLCLPLGFHPDHQVYIPALTDISDSLWKVCGPERLGQMSPKVGC